MLNEISQNHKRTNVPPPRFSEVPGAVRLTESRPGGGGGGERVFRGDGATIDKMKNVPWVEGDKGCPRM